MKLSSFQLAMALGAFVVMHAKANSTNETSDGRAAAPRAESGSGKLDESAFRIISERNIFNANRSGGTVRSTNTRRPARVESFALVGTMAYEKGTFAFFEGTSSEFTKALKPDGVIAGYKVVDILANAVKLEMDGKITQLPIGSGMRREDQGTWKFAEVVAQTSYNGGGSGESNGRESSGRDPRSGRSRRGDDGDSNRSRESSSAGATAATSASAGGYQCEFLKRLMERREKEDQ